MFFITYTSQWIQVVTWLKFNATPVAQQIAGAEPVLHAGALTWLETSELMHHTTPTRYCITKEKMLLEKIEFLNSKVSVLFWIITDGKKKTRKKKITLIKYTAADILLHSEYI